MKNKKRKKFKDKTKTYLGVVAIGLLIAMFYVGILLGIMYRLLLATGG